MRGRSPVRVFTSNLLHIPAARVNPETIVAWKRKCLGGNEQNFCEIDKALIKTNVRTCQSCLGTESKNVDLPCPFPCLAIRLRCSCVRKCAQSNPFQISSDFQCSITFEGRGCGARPGAFICVWAPWSPSQVMLGTLFLLLEPRGALR